MLSHAGLKTSLIGNVVKTVKVAGKSLLGHSRITGWKHRALHDILRPQLVRRVKQPEKIIRSAFDTFAPVSNAFIEEALRNAFNAAAPTPEAIIANFCQGAVLFGKHNTDILHWKLAPERAVITRASAHIPRSLKKLLKSDHFDIRFNHDFETVILGTRREDGSWITEPLVELYAQMYARRAAWCLAGFQGGCLAAGSWGINIGGVWAGMSTFSRVSDAGSLLLAHLVAKLMDGELDLLDCGAPKPHFQRFGAFAVPRVEFVAKVAQCIDPSHRSSI